MRFRDQKTLFVKSPSGKPCPRQGQPGIFISETGEEVRNDGFHRRLLADGSLLIAMPRSARVDAKTEQRQKKTTGTAGIKTKE